MRQVSHDEAQLTLLTRILSAVVIVTGAYTDVSHAEPDHGSFGGGTRLTIHGEGRDIGRL